MYVYVNGNHLIAKGPVSSTPNLDSLVVKDTTTSNTVRFMFTPDDFMAMIQILHAATKENKTLGAMK